MKETKWESNVILVDADYVDKVAFDLTVNFERMIGRRIPQADMAQWLECVALDGGLRPQTSVVSPQTSIQVVLLHKHAQMDNFTPGRFAELDGKAFEGRLGEFLISCVPVEDLTTMDAMQSIYLIRYVKVCAMLIPTSTLRCWPCSLWRAVISVRRFWAIR